MSRVSEGDEGDDGVSRVGEMMVCLGLGDDNVSRVSVRR